jgi:cell division protein FtsQ
MSRTDFLYVHPMQFQRGERNVQIKKQKKRVVLTIRHILVSIVCVALLFFAVYKLYLFLITWDNLNVREVEVTSPNETVRNHIRGMIQGMTWGNILLLDISQVQKNLAAYAWVKNVQVRKIFPSALMIDVTARTPAALMKKETTYLIDGEGIVLEPADPSAHPGLPLLFDERNFIQDAAEKLRLAWDCLKALPDEEKSSVESLDLSDAENVILQFRGSPTKIKLGAADFARNLDDCHKNIARLESEYGVLEYIDLRFPDRVYFKPLKVQPEAGALPNPKKEAP